MVINYIKRFTNRVADKCRFEITKRPLGSIDRMRNCSHVLFNIFAKEISGFFFYTREKGTNLQSLSQTNRWSFQFKIHPSTGKKCAESRWCFVFCFFSPCGNQQKVNKHIEQVQDDRMRAASWRRRDDGRSNLGECFLTLYFCLFVFFKKQIS